EGDRLQLHPVADGGNAAQLGEDETGERVLIAVAQLDVQRLFEVLDQHAAGDLPSEVAGLLELRRLDVELILDLPHDLLDHRLQGDDPGDAAVLVDHRGEVEALGAHPLEQAVELQRLGDEGDLARHVLERGDRALAAEEVLDVDESDDVVEIAFAERETGVAAAAGEAQVLGQRTR